MFWLNNFWLKTCFTSEVNFFPAMPFWMEKSFFFSKTTIWMKDENFITKSISESGYHFLEEINLWLWMLWFSRNFANFVILTKSWERKIILTRRAGITSTNINKRLTPFNQLPQKRRLLDICASRKSKRAQLMENFFF